jgi:hypothetical protein
MKFFSKWQGINKALHEWLEENELHESIRGIRNIREIRVCLLHLLFKLVRVILMNFVTASLICHDESIRPLPEKTE